MVYLPKFPPIDEPKMGIIQYLFSSEFNVPDNKTILIDGLYTDRCLTYQQLKDSIFKFAAGLQDVCNFKTDDVLALYAPNQYNYSIPLFGAVAANGAVTTANPNYNVKELSYQLEQTKAKVLICHLENLKTALSAAKKVGIPKDRIFIFGDETIQGVQPFSSALIKQRKVTLVDLTHEEAKEKVAFLCFSSGTTGKSKGVMTTHGNMTSNIAQFIMTERPFVDPKKDKMMGVLPFFHIFGLLVLMHCSLYWGLPLYVLPRFDLVRFCELVEKYKISYMPLVPPVYLQLAKSPAVATYDLSSWKLGLSGAAPLGVDLMRLVKAKFPHMILKQAYGLTETSPLALMEPTDHTVEGSAGLLVSNMTAKLVDENGNEVPEGERGELWLKGPNVMKGYINNPEATANCMDQEGYFHTGDVAIVDQNGQFFIVDRLKELIKYKGFQVPPAELESILLNSPIILDCAVIGVYDSSQATEIPRAYIVLDPKVAPSEKIQKEIMKYVSDQVVSYKQIRSVCFIDVIPKSNTGKILRRVLRDQANKETIVGIQSKL
ncbi:unnamed protein product [Rhizopus stolonifer]